MHEQIVRDAETRLFAFLRSLSEQLPRMQPQRPPARSAKQAFEEWWQIHLETREFVDLQVLKWSRNQDTDPLSRDAALMLTLRASSSVIALREILAETRHVGGELAERCQSAAGLIELVMATLWKSEAYARDELVEIASRQFPQP